MEKRGNFWLFQRIARTDLEDCTKLSIAFDDQGENSCNNLGSYTRD
jgi:hypothetical protein